MPSGASTWSGVTRPPAAGSRPARRSPRRPSIAERERDEQPREWRDDPQRGLELVLDRRRRRERARDHEPDRRREHEARVPALEQHARRGQRVQAEEPGAGQEREADQQQPRVPPSSPGLADRQRQPGVEHAGREHEPEVHGLDLPALVDLRRGAQQHDQREREREGRCDPAGARTAQRYARAHAPWQTGRSDRPRGGAVQRRNRARRAGRGLADGDRRVLRARPRRGAGDRPGGVAAARARRGRARARALARDAARGVPRSAR